MTTKPYAGLSIIYTLFQNVERTIRNDFYEDAWLGDIMFSFLSTLISF